MTSIVQMLGEEAESLLTHRCTGIPKESLHLPGPDYVDRVVSIKDRKPGVLRSLQAFYGHGRLANSGYLSLLPVDQGVEHSGGASGKDDLHQAGRTAVINKRAGGMGLISGRKAFQKPMQDGVALLNAIQDVYLDKAVTVA
jgi:DhnA family fructose-bisphosphate aldolase class Ia